MESGFTCGCRGSRRESVIRQLASPHLFLLPHLLLVGLLVVLIVSPSPALSQSVGTTDSHGCWSAPCANGGTCEDGGDGYTCKCPTNYNGTNCENDLRQYGCSAHLCQNNGTCRPTGESYRCDCAPGFAGRDCEQNIDECRTSPCNAGTCHDLINGYRCDCNGTGFTGPTCSQNIDECLSSPCGPGTCHDNPGTFTCLCPDGLTGTNCSQDVDECASSPCLHNGTCLDQQNGYSCTCLPGLTGRNCQVDIDDCHNVTCPGSLSRCQDLLNNHTCVCKDGYTGTPPACTELDECESSPCLHGATCQDGVNNFTCLCAPGYSGALCQTDIDECEPRPCRNNGTCVQAVGLYTCSCPLGFTGHDCETDIDECLSSPCQHGATCTDLVYDFSCDCPPGYTDKICAFDINECSSVPCLNNATCVDSVASFSCDCLPGFTGTTCETNIDDCQPNPCQNGASCLDGVQDYTCRCSPDWMGKNCSQQYDACFSSPCRNGAGCNTTVPSPLYTCSCLSGFTGRQCETNIDDCQNATCPDHEICYDGINNYTCACPIGYKGDNCNVEIDECESSPCRNNGSCQDGLGNYTCSCPQRLVNLTLHTPGQSSEFLVGWEGRNCQLDIDECSRYPRICLNGGRCENLEGSYTCFCPGSSANGVLVTGANCEIISSYCKLNREPCLNGGTCHNLYNGFRCSCAPGFTGRTCEINIDECASSPCQYGGTCQDGVNSYSCSCIPGITGPDCQTDIDECQPRPCLHGGQCQDLINGFKCNCTDTGFSGDNCSVNIDDCLSNPCLNNATCVDGIKAYSCSCYEGYSGERCQEDVNECTSSPTPPCNSRGTCLQRSNQSLYTMQPRPPGLPSTFTFANASGFLCMCDPGFTGVQCETDIDECLSDPCLHNSSCSDGVNSFSCSCSPGYEGATCAEDIDECARFAPCQHGAACRDLVADYACTCTAFSPGSPAYGGKNCSVRLRGCQGNAHRCQNGATCVPYLVSESEDAHSFRCACPPGFTGALCENSTTMGFQSGSYVTTRAVRAREARASLRFQTTLTEGVLLVYRPNPTTAVTVRLAQTRLQVAYEDSSSTQLNWTVPSGSSVSDDGRSVSDGSWHGLQVLLADNVTVRLEGAACPSLAACSLTSSYPRPLTPDPNVTLALGSAPGLTEPGFVGCVEDVRLGAGSVLIPGSSAGLVGVREQCGRQPQCPPGTCSYRGQCLDLWYSFRCLCDRPYYGARCQQEFVPATFYVEQPSWVKFVPETPLTNSVDLSFFLVTRQTSSLVAHLSNSNPNGRRILQVQLVGGRVGSQVDLCGQSFSVGSLNSSQADPAAAVDDGYRHQVRVRLTRTSISLSVNDTNTLSADIPTFGPCGFMGEQIYFGGFNPVPAARRRKRQAGVGYFQGVIQDIELNQMKVQFFPNSSYSGPNLLPNSTQNLTQGAVSTQPQCPLSPCQNQTSLACTDLYYNDYSCQCVYGYRGKNCSEPDFCVDATCPSGSTCQSLNKGYECISVASFNGDPAAKTQFSPSFETPRNLTSISAEFRTRALHGVVLFAARGRYFLRLQVERGLASLQYKLDSKFSRTLWLSNRRVDDGRWYKAVVTWEGDAIRFREELGGKEQEEKGQDVPDAHLSLSDFVFGAGAEPLLVGSMGQSRLTGYGFLGCVKEVRVGGVLLPFFPDASFRNNSSPEKFLLLPGPPAPGLTPNCASEGCRDHRCQHGAACNATWRDYTCECPPGYTGRYCEAEVNECTSSPCLNGGLCLDRLDAFSCRCRRGFSGSRCQTPPSVCDVNPCQNGGNCSSVTSQQHSCSCSPDFTGWNCSTAVNTTCEAGPCENGGTCSPSNATLADQTVVESFSCQCPPGYQGPQCELMADACWNDPCRYGNCSRNMTDPRGYTCLCDPGYSGPNCSVDLDYCAPSSCLHGQCVEEQTGFFCNCSQGWQGMNCAEDIDECTTVQPCKQGTCTNGPGNFTCNCAGTGFTGETCSVEVDECQVDQPCQNGASCNNTEGSYLCLCDQGYSGRNCQTPNCTQDLCFNGATCGTNSSHWFCSCPRYYEGRQCELAGPCLNQTCQPGTTERCEQDVQLGNFSCVCSPGWQGENCTEDVDECLADPCEHGASCNNTDGSFFCLCAPGYTGSLCEQEVDECSSSPCVHGVCQDRVNAFFCNCTGTNYKGRLCEEDVDECQEGLQQCQNGATCRNLNGSYECLCPDSQLGQFCQHANPCASASCQNGGTCNYTYHVNNQTYLAHCACADGFSGGLCEQAAQIQQQPGINIWVIIGPIIAILFVIVLISVIAFLMYARTKRATRGTYSPSRQETSGSRVELGNVLKKPPEERLI